MRPTRTRPTPSSRSPTPSRSIRDGSSCWPAGATVSTTRSAPSVRSARPDLAGVRARRCGGAVTGCTSSTARARSSSPWIAGPRSRSSPLHGRCRGVTVGGARWPLVDHDLAPLAASASATRSSAAPSPCRSPWSRHRRHPRRTHVKTHRTAALAVAPHRPLVGVRRRGAGRGQPIDHARRLRLVPDQDTSLNEALAAFTEDTGVDVELVIAGDAGTMVNKAMLTAGNPEGDVMFGVDNTFLSRVVDDEVFEPYEAQGLDAVPDELRRSCPTTRSRRSTSGTCASTTTSAGSPSRSWSRRRPRRPRRAALPRPARRREPGVVVTRPGVPARHRRRVR